MVVPLVPTSHGDVLTLANNLEADQLKQGLLGAGIPGAYADALLDLHAFYKRGGASKVEGDVKRVTGRDPIKFDQFVKENAGAFRG